MKTHTIRKYKNGSSVVTFTQPFMKLLGAENIWVRAMLVNKLMADLKFLTGVSHYLNVDQHPILFNVRDEYISHAPATPEFKVVELFMQGYENNKSFSFLGDLCEQVAMLSAFCRRMSKSTTTNPKA